MVSSRLGEVLVVSLATFALLAGNALSATVPPTPSTDFRDLRDGYVRTWYIYNDSSGGGPADGVLKPGDTRIETFQNWWTPVSAHTQHNYVRSVPGQNGPQQAIPGYDMYGDCPSAPMNFATFTLPAGDPNKNNADYNYWLPERENSIRFYMTYSQLDNNDSATYYEPGNPGYEELERAGNGTVDEDLRLLLKQRNMERNGWALGWVDNGINKAAHEANPGLIAGNIEMAIYVHEGAHDINLAGWGDSRSNPQVAMSNDIDYSAGYTNLVGTQWHPPQYDEVTQSYNAGTPVNQAYMASIDDGSANFNTIVNSMEINEHDPDDMPALSWLRDLPGNIQNNAALNDPDGNPYQYEDGFTDLSTYTIGSSDGGVISGLGGYDEYDPENPETTWHNQQVIRIDISEKTLLDYIESSGGEIDHIIFYDFINDGNGQINPREIVFGVNTSRSVTDGQIFYDPGDPSNPDPLGENLVYFQDNRIYIAQVDIAPEPATMVLLGLGSITVIARRRRKR